MFPSREAAISELELAGQMNPGKWTDHSRYTASAAEHIAARCSGMDKEKAFVCGLLHDIDRHCSHAAYHRRV